MHLLTSYFLFRPIYNKSGDGLTRKLLKGIHTLVNPPLFCDWEEFYRHSNFKMEIPDAWYQSKKLYAKFQALFIIEHLLFLIPMIWLKIDVERRNAVLEGGTFKPVPEEILSTRMVNLLLILGLVVTFAAPLLQAGLAYAYIRYGHPWSRVWRAQVLPTNPESRGKRQEKKDVHVLAHNIKQIAVSTITSQAENQESHELHDLTHREEAEPELAADEIRIRAENQ